ncbi:MAG: DNA repair protein RecO [Bacteroidetes bacterium]|nr:MAG: DNA repair protein RecO [Bacteroidota bacterium]PIE88246.1 MAG: DNA repair protein RecO [Bacteroidota bacterium]
MELCTTRAIILRQIKYSESSLIIKAYTEQSGLQSYLLKGIRKRNGKTGMAVVQPMALVRLVSSSSLKSDLKMIREIYTETPYYSVPFDPIKSGVLVFLNEILNQVLLEEVSNAVLFSFLFHSLEFFDQYEDSVANFHLLFLLQLSKYLGFFPKNNYDDTHPWFDLTQGEFTSYKSSQEQKEEVAAALSRLLSTGYSDLPSLWVPHPIRASLNALLLDYYQYHVPGFREVKSLEVLRMILSD